jgi:hypothetical protein
MKPAVTLLRSRFLHNKDEVKLVTEEQRRLAKNLADLGVLRVGVQAGHFVMSSPLLGSIIQQRVIPKFFPACPSESPPKLLNGRIDILKALEMAVRTFDKGTFTSGYSFKTATVTVGKISKQHVPRESVYQQELTSIIGNWLRRHENYEVETQNCIRVFKDDGQVTQLYSDLMIIDPNMTTTIIELVASETWQVVDEHYKRTLLYATSQPYLNVRNSWTVHFTCEDDYLDSPRWPLDEQMARGLSAVVFWHNLEFTQVCMSALWMDEAGRKQIITKRQILPASSLNA